MKAEHDCAQLLSSSHVPVMDPGELAGSDNSRPDDPQAASVQYPQTVAETVEMAPIAEERNMSDKYGE
jgi:hypothetical protein